MIRLRRMEKVEQIRLTFQLAGSVNVSAREVRAPSSATDRNTTPLNILDILFRQNRAYPVVAPE